jgi:hypothetical protein
MLKIRDDLDLKELEKFGFRPKYDEDTGELKGYFYVNNKEMGLLPMRCGIDIKKEEKPIKKKFLSIRYTFKRDKRGVPLVKKNKIWLVDNYNYQYTDFDILYDLIKANLIVKE